MKVLRVIGSLIALIYVAFLVMCCISPVRMLEGRTQPAASEPKISLVAPKKTEPEKAKIDFAAGSFPADTENLTAVLEVGETRLLDQMPMLKSVDASGSTCYAELAEWAEKHPKVAMTYDVRFADGTVAKLDDTTLDLSKLDRAGAREAAQLVKFLPNLKTLKLGAVGNESGFTGQEVAAIRENCPDLSLDYTFTLLGRTVSKADETLDLTGISHEDMPAVIGLLPDLENLTHIDLGSADSGILWEDVTAIAEACPNAEINYALKLWGHDVNLMDSTVDLNHTPMNDDGAAVAAIVPYMKNLTFLDMDTCGVSHEAMAAIRDSVPQAEVVWRVNFATGYSVRTNVEKILASKPSKAGYITDADAQVLKYCSKLKYLDLGHNETLHDLSFLYGMPNLEVAIFSQCGISDITPLSACPHIEYLELTHSAVSDLTPLANAQELRHLNIGDTQVSDISPLYGLHDLERLWICLRHHVPQDQIDYMHECAPNCEINVDADDPSLGAWRFSDLNDRGWKAWEETGYFLFENHPRYELLRQQFGYAEEAYSFYWLDPLY